MVDRMPVEEGWVYGQKPKDPEAPPDLESLFEAAGVPDKLTNGQPPFSPEWYAGAKERQRVRDAEIEKIMSQRNDVRHQWAELMWTDLSVWRDRIDYTASLAEPLADLQALLARTKHERPDDVARFQEIQEIAAKAGVRQGQVRKHLVEAKEQMMDIEGKVRLKEEEDEAAEKDRLEKKRLAEKRRRRAERALKRNEALLLGEDPPPLVEDSEEEGLQPEDDPKAVQAQLQGSVVLCYFCVACRSRI
ncbi:ADK2 [Symbiodinium sp. CCMP2592]|nr:ADK2 [Symbiodinium sp. CCMP2592]